MDTKPPTTGYHHQRAPRTPESYFNVPESIALLNIVKSEKIQSAFQSNRKNHASVWEMVAEVLNRFSARKRSAKQCCNRYENLKKIYTQLKKNPERHVRRNWPYMFLFKEIEEQRGECWGSNGKRLALLTKNLHHHHNSELSYYQRRRQAVELSTLLNGNKDVAATMAQHGLLQALGHSTDSNSNTCKMERFLPNHFVEAQLTEGNVDLAFDDHNPNMIRPPNVAAMKIENAAALQLQAVSSNQPSTSLVNPIDMGGGGITIRKELQNGCSNNNNNNNNHNNISSNNNNNNNNNSNIINNTSDHVGNSMNVVGAASSLLEAAAAVAAATIANGFESRNVRENFGKDCNGALNLQTTDNNISLKYVDDIQLLRSILRFNYRSEPLSEGEFNPDDIQLMQTNYNGSQNYYPHDINPNLLHPDVIVDTDNMSSVSSAASLKSKRKLSSSTDGDSTNYELIEYLKRREKRDEELFKRMDAREERLLNLLERTVVAIETLAASKPSSQIANKMENSTTNNSNNNNSNNNSNNYDINIKKNEQDNANERTTQENTKI